MEADAMSNMSTHLGQNVTALHFKLSKIILVALSLSGCSGSSISGRFDVAIPPEELEIITRSPDAGGAECLRSNNDKYRLCRNSYVALKLFQIDQNFADYKILLSRGNAYRELGFDVTQIGLAAIGGFIPLSQASKVLSATSAAVGLTNNAINKDLLMAKAMEVIENQMSVQRASVKQTILARLECPASLYPAGLILSDLQAYADSGTVTSALNNITKTTATTQPTVNATTGTATPTTTSTTAGSGAASVALMTSSARVGSNGEVKSTVTTTTQTLSGVNCPLK